MLLNQLQLEDRLRAAVGSVIELATRHGLTEFSEQQYLVAWMVPNSPGSAVGSQNLRTERSFWPLWSALQQEAESTPAIAQLYAAAESHLDALGKPFGMGFNGARNAARALLPTYFETVRSLRLDESVVSLTASQFLSDMAVDRVAFRLVYSVRNFSAPESFDLMDDVCFRPISAADIDKYGRQPNSWDFVGMRTPDWLYENDWLCVVTRQVSRESFEELNATHGIIDDVILSLTMAAKGRSTFNLRRYAMVSPFFAFGWGQGGLAKHTSRHGRGVTLDEASTAEFKSIYPVVRKVKSEAAFEYLRLPLRRLQLAASRTEAEDHFVDCVVALERLLARDTQNLEATFRFKLRGAALLPDSLGNALERASLLAKIYGTRSKIVHGSATQADISGQAEAVEDILREVLIWYLKKGIGIGSADEINRKIDEAMIDGGMTLR